MKLTERILKFHFLIILMIKIIPGHNLFVYNINFKEKQNNEHVKLK